MRFYIKTKDGRIYKVDNKDIYYAEEIDGIKAKWLTKDGFIHHSDIELVKRDRSDII